jgi:hypothetical protein
MMCNLREKSVYFVATENQRQSLKLQKVSELCYVRVCLHVSSRLPLDRFSWNLKLDIFLNLLRKSKFG